MVAGMQERFGIAVNPLNWDDCRDNAMLQG